MAENPLRQVEACGVSVWNDFIRRQWIQAGELKKLITEDGISGVTSNPTIFEKAIDGSSDYDEQLRQLAGKGESAEEIFRELAADDVQMAADVLRPVYDRTNAYDGYVSVEVSPDAAHNTQKTLEDAHWYWQRIQRPNIMIKVPATEEGLPAITQLISEGINVNVTLIFAVEVYEQVMEAFISGLEKRAQDGKSIENIASVASFFVSRVDTLVDKLLEEKAQGGGNASQLKQLEGKAAIANAKIAYEHFEKIFGSERFQALEQKGAQRQRPLWASTSTKNPAYRDILYAEQLIGPDTVDTMPLSTIEAFLDHAIVARTLDQDVEQAREDYAAIERAGISMEKVTLRLQQEGVQKFADSFNQLIDTISTKRQQMMAGV